MEPSRVVAEASKFVAPGRALDLACGRGRNAIFLAEQGWSVIGVDIAPAEGLDVRILDLEMASVEAAGTPAG